MTLRAFSTGGGVQSTAALVLAARGDIDFPLFCFANVGDDSENPATLRYLREVAVPYAEAHGIELVELRRQARAPHNSTLLRSLRRPGSRSIEIPVRVGDGKPGQRRCSSDFKVKVVARELGAVGVSVRAHRLAYYLATGEEPENVCHSCDNPPCCNPRHLFGGSIADNQHDKGAKGRAAKGERNGASRLHNGDIPLIRAAADAGETFTAIGRRFGVSRVTIANIIHGRVWTHV